MLEHPAEPWEHRVAQGKGSLGTDPRVTARDETQGLARAVSRP